MSPRRALHCTVACACITALRCTLLHAAVPWHCGQTLCPPTHTHTHASSTIVDYNAADAWVCNAVRIMPLGPVTPWPDVEELEPLPRLRDDI